MDSGPIIAIVSPDVDLQKQIEVTNLQTVYSLTQYTDFANALFNFSIS